LFCEPSFTKNVENVAKSSNILSLHRRIEPLALVFSCSRPVFQLPWLLKNFYTKFEIQKFIISLLILNMKKNVSFPRAIS